MVLQFLLSSSHLFCFGSIRINVLNLVFLAFIFFGFIISILNDSLGLCSFPVGGIFHSFCLGTHPESRLGQSVFSKANSICQF